jgi:hypothetical protein
MTVNAKLAEIVTIRTRYSRSVSLVHDWAREDALTGYIVTTNGRSVLSRILSSLGGEYPIRAWSLTGPYGSGKSAFALFAASLLGGDPRIRRAAASILGDTSTVTRNSSKSRKTPKTLLPVLVSGSREPLNIAVVKSLNQALGRVKATASSRRLCKKCDELRESKNYRNTSRVCELFGQVTQYAKESGLGGLFLIVDELGKFVEFAAANPEDGDIFILQELAELAARSSVPFLVLTILHQSLERYAEHVSTDRRHEWAKIQGRFEDIAFEEPLDQVLRLLSQAIEKSGGKTKGEWRKAASSIAKEFLSSGVKPPTISNDELTKFLSESWPLHPVTALVLGPLFRRLAQNERSLFSFLTSGEPYGFQEFISTTKWNRENCKTYRLHQLYDYVASSLGPALFAQHRGKHWAEIESALERLKGASELEIQIAKCIGLLQAIGYAGGIPASRAVLTLVLKEKGVTESKVHAAIEHLERRSIIVYRRHADSFALWEGSDIDIEGRLREARRVIDPTQCLASYLSEHAPLRPLVAKRHSCETGTLRYFETSYADQHSLTKILSAPLNGADGRIIYCVPLTKEARNELETSLKSTEAARTQGVLAALPNEILDLKQSCVELTCLNWVLKNTPEIEGDATARRELRARINAAEGELHTHLDRVYEVSLAGGGRCQWFHSGKALAVRSSKSLSGLLSDICDEVYCSTPQLKNELINRRVLSSSAAAARRNLLESMIEHGEEENLGIQGFPPERSMYDSLLWATGIHRVDGKQRGFFPPKRRGDTALTAVWKAIHEFLATSEKERRPIVELFELLKAPPFGLKDGILPVLLTAAMLHYDTELAFYETGTFVTSLSTATVERMSRAPKDYEIQRCRIAGPRALVLKKYAALVTKDSPDKNLRPLSVVRPLIKFILGLPEYVSRTEQLSTTTKEVLRVIKEAREPDQLLFRDLPTACGAKPFTGRGASSRTKVEKFFGTLHGALVELRQAYPKLQSNIEQLLIKAFSLPSPLTDARADLAHRCKLISELAVDAKLRAFVGRATSSTPDDSAWLESVASLIGDKPPGTWTDQDAARFEVNLSLIARTFRHFESLAFEMERSGVAILDGDVTALRVAVTTPKREELERVVRIPQSSVDAVRDTQTKVKDLLVAAGFGVDKELSVALLADLVRQMLTPNEGVGLHNN